MTEEDETPIEEKSDVTIQVKLEGIDIKIMIDTGVTFP